MAARGEPDHVLSSCSSPTTGFPLLHRARLEARSSGRDESDIDSLRLGAPRSGGKGKPRRPVEGSPGEMALVDRLDGSRRAFRAEG
jgi:hypothetical protein